MLGRNKVRGLAPSLSRFGLATLPVFSYRETVSGKKAIATVTHPLSNIERPGVRSSRQRPLTTPGVLSLTPGSVP